MKKSLLLTLAASVALSAVIHADDVTPAAATAAAPAAAPAAAATPVAKNDNPGSLKPGNALLDAAKYDEAVAYFTGIGVQTSDKREPYRLLGLSSAYLGLNKFDDAAASAQKAIDSKKDLSGAWNNLAAAQANTGKRDDAIATYGKGIETVKAAGGDTAKMEANLAALKAAIEAGKPKKVREAEAKAKAEADKAAAAADAAKAAAPADASPAAAAK
jgi:tetratricopeptide (TPR) repeat protein